MKQNPRCSKEMLEHLFHGKESSDGRLTLGTEKRVDIIVTCLLNKGKSLLTLISFASIDDYTKILELEV